MNQVKEMRNANWETRELRSSTTDTSGDTSASGGSLPLTIDKNLQAAANGCVEAMEKMTSTLMEAIERGEKSRSIAQTACSARTCGTRTQEGYDYVGKAEPGAEAKVLPPHQRPRDVFDHWVKA